MTEIKARLHGGVEQKKRKGAEILKAILDKIKHEGVMSDANLAAAMDMERKDLAKYTEYLAEKCLINVKKKMFGGAEISISGGVVSISHKSDASSDETPKGEMEPNAQAPAAVPELAVDTTAESGKPQPAGEGVVAGGEKVVPETIEEFREVCKSLVTDFSGVMRLFCESQSQSYAAALLINGGDIYAASFEHLDEAKITCADDAMGELQARFLGTKGDLEIFQMSEDDYNQAVRSNIACVLSAPIKLSVLKIRIKSNLKDDAKERTEAPLMSRIKGMFSSEEASAKSERQDMLKQMKAAQIGKIQGSLNLLDFARSLKLDPQKEKRFEELRAQKQPRGAQAGAVRDEKKAERFNDLKAQRQAPSIKDVLAGAVSSGEHIKQRQTEVNAHPLAASQDEKELKGSVQDGKKVQTKIDQLYELVEQQGKVRINDALAAKINVTKVQIEQWAMILEEHNLLELKYPTMGEPEIISIRADKSNNGEDASGRKKN